MARTGSVGRREAAARPRGAGRRRRGGGSGATTSGSRVAVEGDSSRARWRRVAEHGRAAGHRQHSAGATDKRGQMSLGPGVSGGVREGERRARQHDGGAPRCGPGQHSAGRHGLNGFESIQKFKRDQNDFKFLQTLTASNRTFPDSKNLKPNTVGKYLR
jgi:hypothetical protein